MTQREATFAVIGGSGFYEIDGVRDIEKVEIETPFGAPSDRITLGTLAGIRVAFLPRHGVGHRILPGEVPQRANIWALTQLGVRTIISVSAVGSLKEAIAPLDMVLPDQLIDRTSGTRPATFFGDGIAGHVAFDEPFCPTVRRALLDAAAEAGVTAHDGGTLLVIEGPAFSTRAESLLYQGWGASVIGMTALPEAKLAREAGMCYATLACVTDYDTWHGDHARVTVDLVIENLRKNVGRAQGMIARVAADVPDWRTCGCRRGLANAIVTPMRLVPEETKRALSPLLERYREAEANGG
jgi:5'-methylthioadenosine phosphorylase